jgi:galactan 5-O-arabinofuranosyltransferase
MKDLQIVGAALFGPIAYLSWRMLLRPAWALGIGVIAALIVIDPYKPIANLVLVAMIPISIKFLQILRRSDERSVLQLAKFGVLFGVAYGLMFLSYSGWFKWSAPGLVLGVAVLLPWRTAKLRAAIYGGITLLVFVVVIWGYLRNIMEFRQYLAKASAGSGGVELKMIYDDYFHFDTAIDPAYVAMWKGDLPGATQPSAWPPAGELGGLGVYTALLFAGFGTAIAFARKRTVVIVMGLVLAGVWFQRFWVAHEMWSTKLVQLYPRTAIELAHILVLFAGFGLYYVVEYLTRRFDPEGLHAPSRVIGAICALTLVFGSAASATVDHYMPYDSLPRTLGFLSFAAQQAKKESLSPYPTAAAPLK